MGKHANFTANSEPFFIGAGSPKRVTFVGNKEPTFYPKIEVRKPNESTGRATVSTPRPPRRRREVQVLVVPLLFEAQWIDHSA